LRIRQQLLRLSLLGALAGLALAAGFTGSAQAKSCDPIDPAACLLPYPNDWFTKKDRSTPTGLKLDLPSSGTPANGSGSHIAVTELNRLDGFSPGSMLITFVPGLDAAGFAESGFPTIVKPSETLSQDSPVLVIDWATGKRVPVIAELDAQPSNDSVRDLLIRPLVNFMEGHHYLVILRGMVDGSGNPIPPSAAFSRIRSGKPSGATERARATDLAPFFRRAARLGIARGAIQLGWDFTVASRRALTSRLLSMRNRAFAALGDKTMADGKIQGRAPTFRVTEVTNFTADQNANLIRRVRGEIDVPCFLNSPDCGPAGTFDIGRDGLPKAIGSKSHVPFVCNIPRSLVTDTGVQGGQMTIYGHGLLGNRNAIVNNGSYAQAGNDYGRLFCAMDWQGMASDDLGTVGFTVLPNLSNFPMLPDRLQQGILNMLYLGRALLHKNGLRTDLAFQFPEAPMGDDGGSVLGTRLTFSGDSQGGIIGGALMAVAPDIKLGSLGVPAINYSTLLDRSVDFTEYGTLMYAAYEKDSVERPLLMALIQQLWDRGEGDGYVSSLNPKSKPLPATPRHRVLMLEAYGDFQVANIATEVEARTIGAKLRTPALDLSRYGPYEEVHWGIPTAGTSPITSGNAMITMDSGPARCGSLGVTPPPIGNIAPVHGWGSGENGQDPHGLGGNTALIRELVAEWLGTGTLTAPDDPSENPPYYIGSWAGAGLLGC